MSHIQAPSHSGFLFEFHNVSQHRFQVFNKKFYEKNIYSFIIFSNIARLAVRENILPYARTS